MECLISLAVSVACGFLSGLGIGGGSLLMVYLTAAAALEQRTAQGVNLLYFLPTAAAALLLHSKNRFVDWRKAGFAILGGAVAAVAGALLSSRLPTDLLRRLFGFFLVFVGISELRTKAD